MSIHHNDYLDLLGNSRKWASAKLDSDPGYFEELSKP